MNTSFAENLNSAWQWRYATKVFDASRKISPELWNTLERALVMSASSFGLQPYHYVVVTDADLRARLMPCSWGQRQVVDCSHFVVLTVWTQVTEDDIDRFLKRVSEVRGVGIETLSGYRQMMVGSLVGGGAAGSIAEWAARQAYLALGTLLTTAALLRVDACPMEGIEPERYDEVLGLKDKGLKTVAACALGYRAAEDKYAGLVKVRRPATELMEYR